ncbi:MAG: 50S ribosomal protein L17 [Bacillota bacterium]
MAKYGRIGRTSSHRKATLRNLAVALFREGRITTTKAKAKETRRFAEKLITVAKEDNFNTRRKIAKDINDKKILNKLFTEIAVEYSDRNGGYTRTLKLEPRRGDNTDMAILELV